MLGRNGGSPFDARNRSLLRFAVHIMWIYQNRWDKACTLGIANNVCCLGVSMKVER